MRFHRSRDLKRTKIEIIPMIDTMFFLLVFFMLSSLALTKMMGMPVNLPKAASATRMQSDNFALTIDKAGAIYLDRTPVTVDTLRDRLAGQPGLKDKVLVIDADESSSHGLVVRCIDAAREAGVTRFAIATQTP